MARPTTGELITRALAGDAWALSAVASWLPNPDPTLRKLGRTIDVYREIMTDGHVDACVQSRKLGVQSYELQVIPGEDKRAAKKAAELARACFATIDIERVISEITDAVLFGYSPIEVIWEKDGEHIVIADLVGKPPEWFAFNDTGELVFLKSGYEPQKLPDMKILLPRYRASYTNPYGEGILSRCFWPVTFKRGGLKFWVQFTEKFGTPFLKGTVPRGTPDEEKRKLASDIFDMVQDAVMVLEEGQNVEPLEVSRSSSAELYEKLLRFCNSEISKAILGQTLTTEIGERGSYAATKEHMEVRADLIEADKKLVCQTFSQALAWLTALNFGSVSPPVVKFYEEENIQKERAERDRILAEIFGAMGLQFSPKYFMTKYNLTEEDLVIPQTGEFSESRTDRLLKVLERLDER